MSEPSRRLVGGHDTIDHPVVTSSPVVGVPSRAPVALGAADGVLGALAVAPLKVALTSER